MSTLFLIGNGFDVNCGMETKYEDVYKKYIKEPSRTENLKRFKDTISGDWKNWSDFEMAMGKHAAKLNTEDEFVECVNDFSVYMRAHLQGEEEKILRFLEDSEIYDAVVEEKDNSLKNFYKGISPNVNRVMEMRDAGHIGRMRIISFNYTTVLDKILENVYWKNQHRPQLPIHIHGILDDGPVLGVDNTEQLYAQYNITRKSKRAFVKPVFNQQYDQLRIDESNKAIEQANTICTYGMSFGDSDLTWRNKIIEWLKQDSDRHLFVYEYDLRDILYAVESEKMNIEDDAKEALLSKWNVDVDDSAFDRIHIPCGKNIFNIYDAIKDTQEQIEERRRIEVMRKIEASKRPSENAIR